MTIKKLALLRFWVCVFAFFLGGCHHEKNFIANRLRFTTEEMMLPLDDEKAATLRFRDGYFDSFVSLFPLRESIEYSALVTVGDISVFMKHDGWMLRDGNQEIYLGLPNKPTLILRGINRNKKPQLVVKVNWQDSHQRNIQLNDYRIVDKIVEIPVSIRILSSTPPTKEGEVKLTILSNWYENGRL